MTCVCIVYMIVGRNANGKSTVKQTNPRVSGLGHFSCIRKSLASRKIIKRKFVHDRIVHIVQEKK